MTRSWIIELMARAIYEAMPIIEQGAPDGDDTIKWHQLLDADYEAARNIAMAESQSVLNTITAAGFAIVPVEPSEAMMDAGSESHTEMPDDCAVIYRAMIAAAIKEQEGRD